MACKTCGSKKKAAIQQIKKARLLPKSEQSKLQTVEHEGKKYYIVEDNGR